MHIISCNAPTFAATREEKDNFFDRLQAALSCIPSEECYVMLGDFNARVGSRSVNHDDWWYERGPHGYGVLNEAGEELLSFLSTNEATVCNTWFNKKDIHKQTWQHPKSRKWHCIDYVIMRKRSRRKCLDVSVMRGADCNTDHRMLRTKVVVGRKKQFRRRAVPEVAVWRLDVTKLKARCVDESGRETSMGSFVRVVEQELQTKWDETSTVQEKWDKLKSALCDGTKTELGYEDRKQPDWFRESEKDLKSLFSERNRLYVLWVSTSKDVYKVKYKVAQRTARRAMAVAKDKWFQRKAFEAERGRHGGKLVWKCIRDIQRGRRGLVPTRSATVRDEDGASCCTTEAQNER